MSSLNNKHIVLAITGGIAAYKTPEIVRRLKDNGAIVRVVMTSGAKAFITPLTLQAVSGLPVSDSLLDPEAEAAMGHIELAKWADLIVIAPTTADVMAKLACGMADDLLTTICLATNAPIAIAPAMNQQMWKAQATVDNLATLTRRQVNIWGPGSGSQACGDVGLGRMLEPSEIVALTVEFFQPVATPLAGQRWLITAGPTREALDPVRYISNHSSGKMGYAIAQAAASLGAEVTLISGPVQLSPPENVTVINVESALQMHQQVMRYATSVSVFVSCAAVADYRALNVAEQKIKKTRDSETLQLTLTKNPDIVASVAALADKPFTVGFAAETHDVANYAKQKLQGKNLDLIAANNVSVEGIGFNSDNNAITVYWHDGEQQLTVKSKPALAQELIEIIHQRAIHDK